MTEHLADRAGGYWARHDLACALNLGAAGLTCVQAGVELLIDTDIWLHRAEFTRQSSPSTPAWPARGRSSTGRRPSPR